jgi:23S rRNA (adenine2503-C2)-methyltransferase
MKYHYLEQNHQQLLDLAQIAGLSEETLRKINHNVHKLYQTDVNQWADISNKNQERFLSTFELSPLKIITTHQSKDGTVKFLFALADGNSIESVIIPAQGRQTICLSSQVGCAIGCTFCHTATQGFSRNLSPAEIVGQLITVGNWLKENRKDGISNIVFMGQGEPLNNFSNVKTSIEIFLDPKLTGLSKNKVTLSTSGLVPQIKNWDEFPDINIAISLHASRDGLRTELMPINQRHNLENLFAALKNIPSKNSKKISYEYLLIKDFNDQEVDIEGLKELLAPTVAKINLIPFNEYPESKFKRPSQERIKYFQNQLIQAGFTCTVRKTMGDDILAACGQLKSSTQS